MYKIRISNSQSLPVEEKLLRDVARDTLAEEGVARASVNVAIVDDATLRELNRRYLDHDYDTDVLSFLLECTTAGGSRAAESNGRRGAGKKIEGEVVVSMEMAARRSREFHWSPQSEVVLYVVHGLLHLAGYDDNNDDEKRLMRTRESAILARWNLTDIAERRDAAEGGLSPAGEASGASS